MRTVRTPWLAALAWLFWVLTVTTGVTGCSQSPPANTFRILAGSEVKPLEPDIVAAARAAGVRVQMEYSGTLDMVDRINQGEPFDAILPPSGVYPQLALKVKPAAHEKLFYSRIVLGVKQSRAHALGWDAHPPGWREVTEAVRAGKLSYAMTNPMSSNSGMSGLFAVAASLAGKTDDLHTAEIDRQGLTDFLKGQKLTAGSSEWLADAFLNDHDHLDGIINYEAVLLRLNERLTGEKLTLIYPREGVISADYPLMLLKRGRAQMYDRVVASLTARSFQAGPVARAYLRPADATIPHAPGLSDAVVVELSFPNDLAVIEQVLSAYQGELRRPATSIYVLDVSGSMEGPRIAGLKRAMELLTGLDAHGALDRYLRFQDREHVVLIPFSDATQAPARFSFESRSDSAATQAELRTYIGGLTAGGGTAIYSALAEAYGIAREEEQMDPDRLVTIVLLTDGENNAGLSSEDFRARLARDAGPFRVRTFPILFGEASPAELAQIATATGGRTFDGTQGDLRAVLREIRGYQ